jgi:hypothetical protein
MAAGLVILGEEGSYILILELSANAAQSLKLANSPQTISNLYNQVLCFIRQCLVFSEFKVLGILWQTHELHDVEI